MRWTRSGRHGPTGRSTRRSPRPYSKVAPEVSASRRMSSQPDQARQRERDRSALRSARLEEGRVRADPRQPCRRSAVVERDYPHIYERFTAIGPLMDSIGNGIKGMAWKTGHEIQQSEGVERRPYGGGQQGSRQDRYRYRRDRNDPDDGAGDQWRGRGQGLGRARQDHGTRHTHLALPKEDEKIRFRDVVSSRARSSRHRRGPA